MIVSLADKRRLRNAPPTGMTPIINKILLALLRTELFYKELL